MFLKSLTVFSLLLSVGVFSVAGTPPCACPAVKGAECWIAEAADPAGTTIAYRGDTIEITTPKGLTLWHRERLTGDYAIRFRLRFVMQGGPSDRLSDMNCFWAAFDPEHPDDLFARGAWRGGIFQRYRSLNLFYVGYGGNQNTTTRFRRYYGSLYGQADDVVRPVIEEYLDAAHLLRPDHWYDVQIKVQGGHTTYSVDGEELFAAPLETSEGDGYWGLRLLENHVLVTGIEIM